MKKLFLLVVFLSVAAIASAQKQSTLTWEGKSYVVTEYPPPIPGHQQMVMISGSAGNAMLYVLNGKIQVYVNPPGGGPYKTQIDQIWAAYLGGKGKNVAGADAETSSASGLTVDGVVSMLSAGLSSDLVVAKIQQNGKTFDLSTDDMVRLKKAGASDAVIKAMMSSAPSMPAPLSGRRETLADAGPVTVAPNAVADSPDMGKLKKESFLDTIKHGVTNAAQGKSVIDRLSMRNILPQWDPNGKISQQYPHIAITVISAPSGWMDDYRAVIRKANSSKMYQPCFQLKATVWIDPTRSKTTDEFPWCVNSDLFLNQLQPTYGFSLSETKSEYKQTTGINRTDGPEPPDKLLPYDRATQDMEAKTNPQGASKDLNMDSTSLFAIMFANVRKDLGETLSSDGDFRVWITTIQKAAGPSLF